MAEQIITKTCRICKQTKPVEEFPKHSTGKDGHRNHCKLCHNRRKHLYYVNITRLYLQTEEGKEKMRGASQQFRQKHPLRVKEIYRKYCQTEKYHARQKRYMESEKYPARTAVCNAVKYGKIQPATNFKCAYCPKQAEEYHHPNYEPEHWLDVIPVCAKCHGKTRLLC